MSDEMGPPEETLDDAIEHVFYPQDDLESKADNSPDLPQIDSADETDEIPDEEARRQLTEELDQLIERVRKVSPEYSPPPFSPQRLIKMISENLGLFSPETVSRILQQLRSGVTRDLFDLDTWKGIWYVVNYSLESQRDLFRRRVAGEYETDEWGYDPEFVEAFKPFFQFLYKRYWRVQVSGMENIPDEGRALLVSNHSGQLPFDGSMVGLAVMNEHPNQRLVRTLYASWFPTLPVISTLFVKFGQTLANEENGIRLLQQEQLVAVYPEGYKGVGKLFKDRYRLARFGRGGFVRMALRTGAPMIPVAVVGAEETYISLAKSDFMARLIGFPYFPISPTFPWLGLLGFIPIPTKWYIDFGEPIQTDNYEPKAANNTMLVSQLTDQMRNLVQGLIYKRLADRKSVLFG
jgi:1-acyl-sn-glycerol-3-phosphate acyltransferase